MLCCDYVYLDSRKNRLRFVGQTHRHTIYYILLGECLAFLAGSDPTISIMIQLYKGLKFVFYILEKLVPLYLMCT